MKYKAVIFDLDGTLLDTSIDLNNAVNKALNEHGFEGISVAETISYLGNGFRVLIKKSIKKEVSETVVDKVAESFKINYRKCFKDKTYIYDGILNLLLKLNEKGIKIAINTNKKQDYAEELVKDRFKNIKFEYVYGEDISYPKKPDPFILNKLVSDLGLLKSEVLFVGDSEVDLKTAYNAEVDSCFVSWGYRSYDQIKDIKHNYVVDNALNLENIIL